jgi:hypothetical protein
MTASCTGMISGRQGTVQTTSQAHNQIRSEVLKKKNKEEASLTLS